MWIDEVVIELEAGRGGDGAISFRREKFVPRGGPDGGNGGEGGSIWIQASIEQNTLSGYRYRPHNRAERGRNGEGSNRTGRSGKALELKVPLGTLVFEAEGRQLICDLTEEGDRFLVARGGRGGRGNAAFATATNRAPRRSERGGPGDKKRLRLELRLLADVGLVGFPNAGKSTFIASVSAARPKIADYPFTTLVPYLGVVVVDEERSFVLADVPGLVPGASQGAGLGDRFLRHLSRTAHLVYFVEVSEASGRSPDGDLSALVSEIRTYGRGLELKPAIVVASKIDAVSDKSRLERLEHRAKKLGLSCWPVSAVTGGGIRVLVAELERRVRLARLPGSKNGLAEARTPVESAGRPLPSTENEGALKLAAQAPAAPNRGQRTFRTGGDGREIDEPGGPR